MTTRILFEGTRAIGVEYRQGGETKIARAAKEVLLCRRHHQLAAAPDAVGHRRAGRIGGARHHGDVPLPGVGKNLQDHVAALIVYGRNGGGPVHRNLRLDRLALSSRRAYFGTGFTTDLPGGLTAF